MSLKSRLDTLRRQSGASTAPKEAPAGSSVAERLDRLGPRARPQAKPTRERPSTDAVAEHVGGEPIANGVVLIERTVSLDGNHGTVPLNRLVSDPVRLPEAVDRSATDFVFLDTETSGLAGGTGTVVFMVGAARVAGEQLRVRQYLLSAFHGEAAMLAHLRDWMADARACVTFNGKRFDLPLLRDRYRLAGHKGAFDLPEHLDLLHPTRRLFEGRWPDCRLATAENRALGFYRQDDMPGSEAPIAWHDFLHRGDMTRLPDVARHNYWDVVSLAALLPVLGAAHMRPGQWSASALGAARAWMKHGDEACARGILKADQQQLDEAGLLELARLHRRARAWGEAVAIWEGLADSGSYEAAEHLAKYYEHVCRDCDRALAYAQRLPDGESAAHRQQRLSRKLDDPASGQLDLC